MNHYIKTALAFALGGAALLGVAGLALREATVRIATSDVKTVLTQVTQGVQSTQVPALNLGIVQTPAVKVGPDQKVDVLVLGSANVLVLRGPVTDESASALQRKILEMSHKLPKTETIYLVLDTPGGSIAAGNALIDTIKALPQKVKTLTLFAASMGFHIAQELDERLVVPRGTLMSHQATFGGMGGEVNSDGTGQLISRLKWSLRGIQLMDARAASRMGLELSAYQQLIKPEYWVDGQDAVDAKAADKVVLASCSKEMTEGTYGMTVNTLFGPLALEFSNCPLISYPVSIGMGNLKFTSKEQELEFNKFISTMFEDREDFVHKFIVTGDYTKFLR